jgi:hypothetical protein
MPRVNIGIETLQNSSPEPWPKWERLLDAGRIPAP